MLASKSSTKSDTSSTIPEPAFCTRSSSMRKTPLIDITNNILGNIGGDTIDFCSQDSIVFANEPDFSDLSIKSFSSQFNMEESTLLIDFIDNDPWVIKIHRKIEVDFLFISLIPQGKKYQLEPIRGCCFATSETTYFDEISDGSTK